MLQLALQELTLTFQLYYGILLGVNFNIHVVSCGGKGGLLIVGSLQYVTILDPIGDIQDIGVNTRKGRAN